MYCLEACKCALFSPEILQAGAVKRLNKSRLESVYTLCILFRLDGEGVEVVVGRGGGASCHDTAVSF